MKHAYWPIKGIGIRLSDVYDYLDAEKLAGFIEGFEFDDKFMSATNAERLALLEGYMRDDPNLLCSIMTMADKDGDLTAINDCDGEYYLLYEPHFPWEKKGFSNADEVSLYIANILFRCSIFTTLEEFSKLQALVGEIDEYGESTEL